MKKKEGINTLKENELIEYKRNNTCNRKQIALRQSGITLIALVVTIVVLLILAGITITFVLGENGIITKAMVAKEKHEIASAEEKIKLAVVEYQVKMKEETLYSILNTVQGLTSIDPENAAEGPPYTVEVDGYQFLVGEDLRVTYLGKVGGIVPEITKIEKQVKGESEVAIKVEAKTKDAEGLNKLVLLKEGNKIEEKEITGKQVAEEFIVTSNGKYMVKVIGTNKKQAKSSEIEVTEIITTSGSIEAGTPLNAEVVVTVKAETRESSIKKIELYVKGNKQEEITYEIEEKVKEQKLTIPNMAFYEDLACYANIIDSRGNVIKTNDITVKNTNTVVDETDLIKLSTLVGSGTNFSGKTVKQKEDITLTKAWNAIGSSARAFQGTYDGQSKIITGLQINNTKADQGLFGYTQGATIKNVILGTGSVRGLYNVGGIVGNNRNTLVSNCINNATKVTSTGSYEVVIENIEAPMNLLISCTGGIVGINYGSDLANCINKADITGKTVGGIIGYDTGNNYLDKKQVTNCSNSGTINSTDALSAIGGIVSFSCFAGTTFDNCSNSGVVTSLNGVAGGIAGWMQDAIIQNSNNSGKITGDTTTGGIIGWTNKHTASNSNKPIIRNCFNTAEIATTGMIRRSFISFGLSQELDTGTTGGIIGLNGYGGLIEQCYNTGSVTAKSNVLGGIAGWNYGAVIRKCYNTANLFVPSAEALGGITGFNYSNSTVEECYNTGNIIGKTLNGGIVSGNVYATIKNCYNTGTISRIRQRRYCVLDWILSVKTGL